MQARILANMKEEQIKIAQDLLDSTVKQLKEMGFAIKVEWWDEDNGNQDVTIENWTTAKVVQSFEDHLKETSQVVKKWPKWKQNMLRRE